ncbi:MAG: exo-alpha-sialidase [Sedimentisphaerales bacterium]|nr:exo-alpha-sialidase [Sedimentisphaerales bacterium]
MKQTHNKCQSKNRVTLLETIENINQPDGVYSRPGFLKLTGLILAGFIFLSVTWTATVSAQAAPIKAGYAPSDPDLKISFKVIGSDPPAGRHLACRQMLVGPWHNQPEPYPGYNGFVGWSGTTRLKSGRWLVTFSSGFWHASFPWTDEYRNNPDCRKWVDNYHNIGCPDIPAPRGGRAHVIYSDDQGKTWSNPQTLIDTENDDRHATILELDNGTLLCTFFEYRIPPEVKKKYMLSTDAGKTWSEPVELPSRKRSGFGCGSAIQISDSSIIWLADGVSVHRSTDRGKTFKLAADEEFSPKGAEPTIAELPDGRLIVFTRSDGGISWSSDQGSTWTKPVSASISNKDPHLLMLPNGVLACFHMSRKAQGLRVALSPDYGKTWHGPADHVGYAVDPDCYGYSHPMLLPDGSIYITYQHSIGYTAEEARTQAIWGLRLRIRENAQGIDLLPTPDTGCSGL